MNDMNTLKSMLKNGATEAELVEQLRKTLGAARKELEEERAAEIKAKLEEEKKRKVEAAKAKELDIARDAVVISLMRYLVCLGVIKPEDINAENKKAVADSIKETEVSFKAMLDLYDSLNNLTKNSNEKIFSNKQNFCVNSEKMIQDFIHSIM